MSESEPASAGSPRAGTDDAEESRRRTEAEGRPRGGRGLGHNALGRAAASRGLRLLAVVLAGGWLVLEALEAAGGPAAIRSRHGLWAGAFLVPVQTVLALVPIPSELVAVPTASIYGFWLGAGLIWLGWVAATPIRYAIGRRVTRDLEIEAGLERLPGWLRRFPVGHAAFLVFGRWLPYGPHLVDYAAAAAGVPFARVLWSAAVSTAAPATFFSAVANGLLAG